MENQKESFPLSLVVDGKTIPVENWMIVMAFALRGIPWAIKLADDPTYDLRGKYRDYEKRRYEQNINRSIEYYEREIIKLKESLEEKLNAWDNEWK